jgi:hypothetical protein
MPGNTLASTDPTAGGEPATDDYLAYLDTLRDLGNQGAAVNTALLKAHTADTAHARRAALTELHTRLRHRAATANHALGAWPDPDATRHE